MSARFQPPFGWAATIFATIAVIAALVAVPMSAGARSAGHGALHHVKARASLLTPCTLSFCQFPIQVNPALLSGPLDCPAIHNAAGTITITNRFRATGRNDDMMIDVTGLPPSRGFDLFL